MSTIDVLDTEFNLKGNYAQKMKDMTGATSSFASSFDKVNRSQLIGGFARNMAMAAAAVGALGIALGANAMKDSAQFDSMVKGLEAVEGSAERARKKLEDLRDLARAPGIGFEEAVGGYGALRRGGVTEDLSSRLVKEAGNANAASGGSVATFEQIMRAFGQIAAKPTLQGDELLQLNEAGLPIQKMLKEAFGTSDTESLKKAGLSGIDVLDGLAKAMAKMPRVAGGFQNTLDNMADAIKRASVSVGDGLNSALLPGVDSFGSEITALAESGALETLGTSLGHLITSSSDAVGGVNGLASALQDWVDGATTISEWLQGGGGSALQDGAFGPIGGRIYDWVMGGDIRRNTVGIEARTNLMQEDPKVKAYLERQQAGVKDREEKKAKDAEDAKKRNSVTNQVLKKIEENTSVLPNLMDAAFGGGELARLRVTPHEIKAARLERKIARNIRMVGEIGGLSSARLASR